LNTLASALRLWSADARLISWYLGSLPKFYTDFPGSRLALTQTYRTPAQQQVAALTGRSGFDGSTSFSLHQVFPSAAIDLGVYDQQGNYIADGTDSRYSWLGQAVVPGTFRWGGTFSKPDYDHVELLPVSRPDAAEVASGYARYQAAVRASGFLT
jgi:hypothetical protein